MNLTERIAYIRGLAEGLKLDENKDEVKVINAIIDLLEDMAYDVTDMEDIVDDVCDQVDEIDEDLSELEEEVYGSYEDYDDEPFDDDDVYYEVTCGKCGEVITVDEDVLLEGEIVCPNCGEHLEFDFSELNDEDCGCDCGCDHDHKDHADEDLMS
jgi:formylmethanofuran dehydrogenase subunit E